jgi:hypothetical protein
VDPAVGIAVEPPSACVVGGVIGTAVGRRVKLDDVDTCAGDCVGVAKVGRACGAGLGSTAGIELGIVTMVGIGCCCCC